MSMRRRPALQLLCAWSAWPLWGCAPAPLRLGIIPWIGFETLRMGAERGWVPASVQLRQMANATEVRAALQRNELDAATLTLDEMLASRGQGVPLAAVLVMDQSAGADMLVARPAVGSLAGLRGRRIAVEESAVGALVLVTVLQRAGLDRKAVEVVPMPVNEQPAAWAQNRIDAAITFEPTASHLLRESGRRLFDSRTMPDTLFDVLAVRRDRLATCGAAVGAAVRSHFVGLNHLRVNRADAVHRIARQQGVSPAEVRAALAGVALPDLARNKALLTGEQLIRGPAQRLADLMLEHGLLARHEGLGDAFEGGFLPAEEPQA